MRLLLIGGVSSLLVLPLAAQPVQTPWRAGVVAFGGPGVMLGAELSRRLPSIGAPEFALDVTVLTRFYRSATLACLHSGCSNTAPTEAKSQVALSVATSVPLRARVFVVASGGVAITEWKDHHGPDGAQALVTIGLGRAFGERGSRLEVRAAQLSAGQGAERGVRASWHLAW
jgi:hypothetical protein